MDKHLGRRIIGKFFLIASLFFAAALLLGILLWEEKHTKVTLISKQLSGLDYSHKIVSLIDHLRLHRFITCIDNDIIDPAAVGRQIAEDFEELTKSKETELSLSSEELEKSGKEDLYPLNIKRLWESVEQKPKPSDYTQIENRLQELLDTVIDNTNLMTLFDRNVARLIDCCLYEVQNSKDRLDKILRIQEKNEEVKALLLLQKNGVDYIENSLRKCFTDSFEIRKNLENHLISWKEDVDNASALITQNERLSFKKSYPQILQSQGIFQKALFDEIEDRLIEERAEYEQATRKNFIVTALVAAMAIAIAVILSKRISQPLAAIIGVANDLKKGNLDARVKVPPRSSGLKELAVSINLMAESLHDHIKNADEATASLKKIVVSMSDDATQNIFILQKQKTASKDIENDIQTSMAKKRAFFDKLSKLGTELSSTEKLILSAKEKALSIESQMKSLESKTGNIKEKTHLLLSKVQASQSLSLMLTKIFSDTHLVAMNASIEAEKEGDGKTFAILAASIRKLSDEAKTATKEISSILTELQNAATETGEETGSFDNATQDALRSLTDMNSLFHSVEGSLAKLVAVVDTVSSSNTTLLQNEKSLYGKLEELVSSFETVHQTSEQFLTHLEQLKQLANQPKP